MYKNLPELTCYRLNIFYDKLFGGNPANVVFSQTPLKDELMFKLSQELALPETVFISNLQTGKNCSIDASFFTINGSEIDFCGHLAIGTIYSAYLESDKKFKNWTLNTKQGGVLKAVVEPTKNGKVNISIQANIPKLYPVTLSVSEKIYLQTKFGVSINSPYLPMINPELENMYIHHDNLEMMNFERVDFVPFISERNLLGLVFINASQNLKSQKDYLGRPIDIEVRATYPGLGIKEDPQSGSAPASVIEFALHNHLIQPHSRYIISQGAYINRPGSMEVFIKDDCYWIRGSVVLFHKSKLEVK